MDDQDNKPQYEALKQRVKEAIRSKKVKLAVFSRESGIPYPTVLDYSKGRRKPGFLALAKLLKYTGVSGKWLLLGEGEMLPDQTVQPARLDERLMAEVAQVVEIEQLKCSNPDMVADGDDGDYFYARLKRELKNKLNRVGEYTVLAASVYNRVAHLPEGEVRRNAILIEARAIVRLNRSINATRIGGERVD